MRVRFSFIGRKLFLMILLAGVMYGCSTTPMVWESYTEEEVLVDKSGFGLLVDFNPVGQAHESCELGNDCWIFSSPYDVYFEISSHEEMLGKVCFLDVEFRLEDKVLYSSEVNACYPFEYNKSRKDYRAYERLPEVDIGFHGDSEVTVILHTEINGQLIEHRVKVRAKRRAKKSSDLMRHMNSV